jgi:hypothetical protein
MGIVKTMGMSIKLLDDVAVTAMCDRSDGA